MWKKRERRIVTGRMERGIVVAELFKAVRMAYRKRDQLRMSGAER